MIVIAEKDLKSIHAHMELFLSKCESLLNMLKLIN